MKLSDTINIVRQGQNQKILVDDPLISPMLLKEFCQLLKNSVIEQLIIDYKFVGDKNTKKILKAIKKSLSIKDIIIYAANLPESIASNIDKIKKSNKSVNIVVAKPPSNKSQNKDLQDHNFNIAKSFPNELLLLVFSFLSDKGLYIAASTCRKFEQIAVRLYYIRYVMKSICMQDAEKIFTALNIKGIRLRIFLRNSLIANNKLINPLKKIQLKIDSLIRENNSCQKKEISITEWDNNALSLMFYPIAYLADSLLQSTTMSNKKYKYEVRFWKQQMDIVNNELGPFDMTIEHILKCPNDALKLIK